MTVLEDLKRHLERVTKTHGEDDFVAQQLRRQIKDLEYSDGRSAEELYRMGPVQGRFNPQKESPKPPTGEVEDQEELLDSIHVTQKRLLMLRRNGAQPALIEEWSRRLKDMQSQLEST